MGSSKLKSSAISEFFKSFVAMCSFQQEFFKSSDDMSDGESRWYVVEFLYEILNNYMIQIVGAISEKI